MTSTDLYLLSKHPGNTPWYVGLSEHSDASLWKTSQRYPLAPHANITEKVFHNIHRVVLIHNINSINSNNISSINMSYALKQ